MSPGIALLGTGGSGKVAKTINSGVSWQVKQTLGAFNTLSMVSVNEEIALLGSDDGHIWRSTNEGENWTDLGRILLATRIYCFCTAWVS